MRPLKATEPSCMMIRPRRRDCTLPYKVKIIALYTSDNKNVAPRERVLVDVATNEEWTKKCRNDEDYDVEVLDVKPDAKYDFVQIVIQQDVDRRDTSIGKINIFFSGCRKNLLAFAAICIQMDTNFYNLIFSKLSFLT